MRKLGKPEAAAVRPSTVEGRLTDAELRTFVAGPYLSIVHVVALAADSWAAAEDAVHEALARAWERGGIEHLDRWVLAVALNLSRSRWRKVGRERPLSERPASAATDTPEDVDVRRAVGRLPRRQREAVVLHYLLDLPVAEIASVTGLSEGGVKHALYRGRRSLAAALGVDGERVER